MRGELVIQALHWTTVVVAKGTVYKTMYVPTFTVVMSFES